MKTIVLLLLFAVSVALAQKSPTERLTIFYFGGSDCPYSMSEKNIANIDKMRDELSQKHSLIPFKFVMVVMDEDIDQGIQFAKKYKPWDEVSIGQFYQNELMLEHVNRSAIPGVPHIMIYRDSLVVGQHNIPTIKQRTLVLDLVGESAISDWIQSGYPIIW